MKNTPQWLLKKQTKQISKKQEKNMADITEGNVTINSGTFYQQKGDVEEKNFLFECKCTEKKSYSLNIDTLKKIEKEAEFKMKTPALLLTLKSEKNKFDYVVLRMKDFLEMKIICQKVVK